MAWVFSMGGSFSRGGVVGAAGGVSGGVSRGVDLSTNRQVDKPTLGL